MQQMRIELFSRATLFGRKWFFRIRSSNLQVVAQSEAYSRHIDAKRTAESIKQYAGYAEIVDDA